MGRGLSFPQRQPIVVVQGNVSENAWMSYDGNTPEFALPEPVVYNTCMGFKDLITRVISGRGRIRRTLFEARSPFYLSEEAAGQAGDASSTAPIIDIPDPVRDGRHRLELGDSTTIELAAVHAGEYERGSKRWFSGEKPIHRVRITHSFWMGIYPITQKQYGQATGENPSHFDGDDRPVEMVTWYEAMRYCTRLTTMERESGELPEGYEYRLPTEGEWEYAAKGGSDSDGYRYSGGNDVEEVAWHGGPTGGHSSFMTRPVGMKAPNKLGLYDMSGNVWEWCYDWHEDYPKVPGIIDPTGPEEGSHRLLRGGSWGYEANCCRVTRRDGLTPGHRYCDVGFRVVLAPSLKLLRMWSRKLRR